MTDNAGMITGAHRTWLDTSGKTKAPLSTPRRAMGSLLGNGVRFERTSDVLVAGEGIETMLSLRRILPSMPMIAGLSANHLAALLPPNGLRRLYIARDNDPAGRHATRRWPNARTPPGSRRCRFYRRSATSTTICASSGCELWQRGSGSNSPGRTPIGS